MPVHGAEARSPAASDASVGPPTPSAASPAAPAAPVALESRFPQVESASVGLGSAFPGRQWPPLAATKVLKASAFSGSTHGSQAKADAERTKVGVGKKRKLASPASHRLEEDLDDGEHTASDSGAEDGGTTAGSAKSDEVCELVRKKRVRGYRKATHTIRKEEKEKLQKELEELNCRMVELQRRALNLTTVESEEEETLEQKSTSHNVLCHLLKRQQLEFATIRKMVTESTACAIRGGSPIQRTIHLSHDLQARRALLLGMKEEKIKDALEFLETRLPDVDIGVPMDEDFRFESSEGDFYACQFTISQFEGMSSARRVFDQLIYYMCNVEISISEKLGHLTIREDDDIAADGVSQNKIVSTTVHHVKMESNTVLFSQFFARSTVSKAGSGATEDTEFGVIVSDFVDVDERHPYRPSERIRKDVSNVIQVKPYWRTTPEGKREQVVVLIRWSHSRLRRPEFPVPRIGWIDLRDKMDAWSKSVHMVIMETMSASSVAVPPPYNPSGLALPRGREFSMFPWS